MSSSAAKAIRDLEESKRSQYLEFEKEFKEKTKSFSLTMDALDWISAQAAVLTGGWTKPETYTDEPRKVFHRSIAALRALKPLLDRLEREPPPSLAAQAIAALGKTVQEDKIKKIAADLHEKEKEEHQEKKARILRKAEERWTNIKALFVDQIPNVIWIGCENCLKVDREWIRQVELKKSENIGAGMVEIMSRGLRSTDDISTFAPPRTD